MEDARLSAPTEPAAAAPVPPCCGPLRSRVARKLLLSLAGLAGLVVLVLALQGTFGAGKVTPGIIPIESRDAGAAERAVPVLQREIEDALEWPGTVRSRTEAQVSSRLMARIRELRVEVGTIVKSGDAIAVLDGRDLASRAGQARASLEAAEAQAVQAEAEHRRVKGLFDKEAATARDLEAALARTNSARAQVEQARHAVAEAEVMVSEGVLRAPFDGVVTEKFVQAGDTAVPGKPLVTLQDPQRLRLEAAVPESCARKASLGMEVRVRIDAIGRETTGRIEEIAPVADPESGTFLLKAGLASAEGLRPGMFGRLLQPCGKRKALLIPVAAVARSGQLEMVRVVENGEVRTRHVRTGKISGALVEVLSGLREGERVLPEGR